MTIYILTYCPMPQQLYGNLLALRTARTGFPNSEIIVTDNCSCPEGREIFQKLCIEHNYEYRQIDTKGYHHHEYIQDTIDRASGPIALVDPDVVFWSSCEHFLDDVSIYDIRLKGMYYPTHYMVFPVGAVLAQPRLHTSFLCLSDAQEVNYLLKPLKEQYGNPWCPTGNPDTLLRAHYDCGSLVYKHLQDFHQPFTDQELDCYDHLRCGTHLDVAIANTEKANIVLTDNLLVYVHQVALEGDYSKLKGIWRKQQEWLYKVHDTCPKTVLDLLRQHGFQS